MRKSSKIAVSDVAVLDRPVTRTAAVEACFYPVDDTMSGGYSLDSGLNGPVTGIYNPEYHPATPHKIVDLSHVPDEVPDVLVPYYGKRVELLFLAGRNHVTGKNIEAPLGECAAIDARNAANRHAAGAGMSVIIRCMESGGNIDIVSATKRTASRTSARTATVKTAKVLTPEEIEAQALAQWKADYDAAVLDNAKFDKKREKEQLDLAANLKKAAAAQERQAQLDLFMRPQGATPKEQNYAWNERHPGETANFGWKQIAEKFAKQLGHMLVQASRPCEASLPEGKTFIGPAFKIVPAVDSVAIGQEFQPGWYRIL